MERRSDNDEDMVFIVNFPGSVLVQSKTGQSQNKNSNSHLHFAKKNAA